MFTHLTPAGRAKLANAIGVVPTGTPETWLALANDLCHPQTVEQLQDAATVTYKSRDGYDVHVQFNAKHDLFTVTAERPDGIVSSQIENLVDVIRHEPAHVDNTSVVMLRLATLRAKSRAPLEFETAGKEGEAPPA